MINLLVETIDVLRENNKTPKDVLWCSSNRGYFSFDEFVEKAQGIDYDNGYGRAEIFGELVIVGDNWWLERAEYDGSEWWEFKTIPKKPESKADEVVLAIKDRWVW
jgi:hypothetical protein